MRGAKTLQINGFVWVLLASIIWGTIGVATQSIYQNDVASPLFINLMRTLIATPVLWGIGWKTVGHSLFRVNRRALGIMCLMGICLVLSQVMYFSAIRYAGVTISTLMTLCIPPLLVASLALSLKMETLQPRVIMALVCALTGCVFIVSMTPAESLYPDVRLGLFYSLASAIFYAGMLLCGRFVANDYHPLQVTAIGFSAGAVVLLLMALVTDVVAVQSPQSWALVVYLGVIPTAFAYWIFQIGLKTVSATTASIVVLIDPVVAAGLAWLLFGEILPFTGWMGAGLLLLSLLILGTGKQAATN